MKNTYKRIISLFVAVLFCIIAVLPTSATIAEGVGNAVDIPFGKDISEYNPEKDGYYGLLPMQYEVSQSADVILQMAKVYVPVLVSEGHLYISTNEIDVVLGLTVKHANGAAILSAYERHLAVRANSDEALFYTGDYWEAYASLMMKLSAPAVSYNGSLWIPLQDICVIFDLGLHQEMYEDGTFITVYRPNENVVDVLSYLYNNSDDCITSYSNANLEFLSGSSALAQTIAKMIDGDKDAWIAFAASCIGFGEMGKETLLKTFVDDLTVDLMCTLPDEAIISSRESFNQVADFMTLLNTEYLLGGIASTNIDYMDAVLEARVSSSSLVNDPRWFSEALDRMTQLTEQKKRLEALNTGVENSLLVVSTVIGVLNTALTYESVNAISSDAVAALAENQSYLAKTNPMVLEEIITYSDFMRSGVINYSLYDYISKNVGSWIMDGLTAFCPAFSLIKLSSHLIPGIAEGVTMTHSFQLSLLSMPLQSDVQQILTAKLSRISPRNANVAKFMELTKIAYLFLKTCYISCNLGTAALTLSDEELAPIQNSMVQMLEKMSVLSTNYAVPQETLQHKYYRLLDLDDSILIDNFTLKMYLLLSGEVLEKSTNAPVTDAKCSLTNWLGEFCGEFEGTPNGEYAELFVPVYEPAGCMEYDPNFEISIKMLFISPTISGEDTIDVKDAPGAVVDPVDTAYLESSGFVIGSAMGEIGGVLYSISTQYITDSSIQKLVVPDDGSSFYVTRFAYYNGMIYYLEKTPGTDETVDFRLCCTAPDSDESRILVDTGIITWTGDNFVIEDGVITWQSFNPADRSKYFTSYNLADGSFVENNSSVGPLTRLILGEYPSNAVVLTKNDDDTWTLYHRLLNNEDAESLSHSLLTVDENGGTTVKYQGMSAPRIDGVHGLFAIYNGYAYMSAYEDNYGILYKVSLGFDNSIIEIGRHLSAGGGDAFFNN